MGFSQQALAQITWYHAITLLDKLADPETRTWYIRQTIAQGWSRNVLVLQIEAEATAATARPSRTSPPRCPRRSPTWPATS